MEIEFPEQGIRMILELKGKGTWTQLHEYWRVEGFEEFPVFVFLKTAKGEAKGEGECLKVHSLSLPVDFILGKLLQGQ